MLSLFRAISTQAGSDIGDLAVFARRSKDVWFVGIVNGSGSRTYWFEQGMMPHEIQRIAGHSSIETTMKYYVGIRETMIDRARQASSAALGTDFGTHLARAPQNARNVEEEGIALAMQTLINAGVINIGVTVLRLNRWQL